MGKAWVLALVLFFVSAVGYAAQGGSIREQLHHCASIQDDLERLECFDAFSRAAGLAPVAPAGLKRSAPAPATHPGPSQQLRPTTVSGWKMRIERDGRGRIHDVIVETRSVHGTGLHGVPVTLGLRCLDQEPSVYVGWEAYVGSGTVPVFVTIDGAITLQSNWTISSNGARTYYPGNAGVFIRSLTTAKRLSVRVAPYGGYEISASFNMTGIGDALRPLEKACGSL